MIGDDVNRSSPSHQHALECRLDQQPSSSAPPISDDLNGGEPYPAMTDFTVQPISRSGGWDLETGQGDMAKWFLGQARTRALQYEELLAANPDRKSADRATVHRFWRLNDEARLCVQSAVVFSAMAIEAFLNFYGVVRLGEAFYSKNYERLGMVPKLCAIVATCCGVLLDNNSEIISVARRLSDRRNSLVHPKTREIPPERFGLPGKVLTLTLASDAVADMDRFLSLFVTVDPQATVAVAMLGGSSLTSA